MANHLPLSLQFIEVRTTTEVLCKPLSVEDYAIQIVWFASPPKWHLAHSTWFFESFILEKYYKDYRLFDDKFSYLFNSYYISKGERITQSSRGTLAHPPIERIYEYRQYVNKHIEKLLQEDIDEVNQLVILGLNHEQQHQELLLSDIKYNWGTNPLYPVYSKSDIDLETELKDVKFLDIPEGVYEIGYKGNGFCFDNELGMHKQYLSGAKIAQRTISNREYSGFVKDGGYNNPLLWLSDGWKWKEKNNINCPLYWKQIDGKWHHFTLLGMRELDCSAPVSHISYYEAKAFARWAGLRLPTEFEWEVASILNKDKSENYNLLESGLYTPVPKEKKEKRFIGNLWEWTESAYLPYPRYKQEVGAMGEYNGKFMVNQMVLRGGSYATPKTHIRETYRNFYAPEMRWMFSGLRLAKDSD